MLSWSSCTHNRNEILPIALFPNPQVTISPDEPPSILAERTQEELAVHFQADREALFTHFELGSCPITSPVKQSSFNASSHFSILLRDPDSIKHPCPCGFSRAYSQNSPHGREDGRTKKTLLFASVAARRGEVSATTSRRSRYSVLLPA